MLLSKIDVTDVVLTALAVYVKLVFVVRASIKKPPLAIASKVSWTTMMLPTAKPVVLVSETVTVLEPVLCVIAVIVSTGV